MSTTYKNHTVLGPINSWILNNLSGYMDTLFGKNKKVLFENHPNTVIEIGAGAGANMRYLRKGTRLIAIEPNIHMHGNLHKSANKYGIELEIKTLTGESIDLPDNYCEFVIGTLVLCTVTNPIKCIEQIKRILKPAGAFIFLEHVKAKENILLDLIQRWLHKPWHWFFEGCHTNRDTQLLLESSGFSKLEITNYYSFSPFVPIIPQIYGRAIK